MPMTEILDDPKNIKLKPYIYLRSGEAQNLLPLLDEKDIAYRVEKILFDSKAKSIIPLNSNQLDEIDSIIYVAENQLHFVEQFLEKSMPIENDLAEKKNRPHQEKINWKVLIGTIAFVLILGVQFFFIASNNHGVTIDLLVADPSFPWYGRGCLFGGY